MHADCDFEDVFDYLILCACVTIFYCIHVFEIVCCVLSVLLRLHSIRTYYPLMLSCQPDRIFLNQMTKKLKMYTITGKSVIGIVHTVKLA